MTIRYVLTGIMLLSATACHLPMPEFLTLSPQRALSVKLDDAREALRKRQFSQAQSLLTEIAAAPAAAGITDEALIRLALLQLRSGQERDAAHALRSIERLAREFPDSQWAHLAVPVADLVNRNQSLSRDNRSLKQNIQKIKELELELEQSSPR